MKKKKKKKRGKRDTKNESFVQSGLVHEDRDPSVYSAHGPADSVEMTGYPQRVLPNDEDNDKSTAGNIDLRSSHKAASVKDSAGKYTTLNAKALKALNDLNMAQQKQTK